MRKTSYRSSGSTSGDLSREDPSVDTARGPRHDLVGTPTSFKVAVARIQASTWFSPIITAAASKPSMFRPRIASSSVASAATRWTFGDPRPRAPASVPLACLRRALRVPTSRGCRPWRGRDVRVRRRRTAASSAADVDRRTSLGVRLCLTQYLVGYGGCVAFSEEDEADQVDDRVALRPAEVAVRRLPRRVAQV
jgi:hypothetical protein